MNAIPALISLIYMLFAVTVVLGVLGVLVGACAVVIGTVIGVPLYLTWQLLRGFWWLCCWPSNYLNRRQTAALKEFK